MSNTPAALSALPPLAHPDGSPIRALVVEDEPTIADLLRFPLQMIGWEATVVGDGLEAVRVAREIRPDVLVLDRMLPGIEGLEVLRRIRALQPDVPSLMLTAMDAPADRVQGLASGADDYVTKPFTMEEVLLRLHRLVQRAGATSPQSSELVVGDLVMNLDTHEVTRGGEEIALTATQYQLLQYLMENPQRVLSKAQILDAVWNYDFGGQANIVELYVSYLRKKIDVGREPMIRTVRGAGYMLKPA
ncbi:response regulator transcription factor [Brachybacterium halotolerans subsp. kimchii]|uniref:Response regulator transcription factor n=1 Tax=Brachybacterium halotolerans TaxID=2795215 RepID=A0ABS1BC64_9MICO|nr:MULTISPECIES: response regulator transcription factor [Brachybacterium]MBK0332251.1 response regulator transcription factor [Brachybacterium halotolerans]MCG7310413.1 response regulator transcription factor [Brachybacterium sp. ACRRE]UEJ83765.1 response regulator transcription factor [Brachybacterium halotolerans subsp. kimchii]